jgi:hypothetical protein
LFDSSRLPFTPRLTLFGPFGTKRGQTGPEWESRGVKQLLDLSIFHCLLLQNVAWAVKLTKSWRTVKQLFPRFMAQATLCLKNNENKQIQKLFDSSRLPFRPRLTLFGSKWTKQGQTRSEWESRGVKQLFPVLRRRLRVL